MGEVELGTERLAFLSALGPGSEKCEEGSEIPWNFLRKCIGCFCFLLYIHVLVVETLLDPVLRVLDQR